MDPPAGAVWSDVLGAHDAMTAPGNAGTVPGPNAGCGTAYDASSEQRLVVADAAEFDLDTGSFDFYVQVPPPGALRGVLGRDALDQESAGHVTVFFAANNQLVLRVQDLEASHNRCSPVLAEGSWIRVGVNFGPPAIELYVDGELATEPMAEDRVCNQDFAGGIAGNDNPWIFGYSAGRTEEGSDEPAVDFLGTAIDEFRLSRVRRAY